MFRLFTRVCSYSFSRTGRIRLFGAKWKQRNSSTFPIVTNHRKYLFASPVVFALSLPFFKKKEPEELMKEAWALGLYYIHTGDFPRAEERLHVVHGILSEQYERGEITDREYQGKRARVTSEMANLALLTGAFEKAEKLLVSTIRDCAQCGLDPRGPEIVEMSLKLAQVMAGRGRLKEADSGFRFCVDSMKASLEGEKKETEDEDEIKNRRALLGISSTAYAKFLQSEEKYADALRMILMARTEAGKIYDEVNDVPVSLMSDEAAIRVELGEVEKAEKILREAIEIVEFRPDILIHLLPILYANLGSILLRQDRLKDSEEAALVALRLLKDFPDSRSNAETKTEADALLAKLAALKAERVKLNSV